MRGRAPAVVGSPTRAEGRVALVRVPHGVPGPTHLRAPSTKMKNDQNPRNLQDTLAHFIGQGETRFMETHLTHPHSTNGETEIPCPSLTCLLQKDSSDPIGFGEGGSPRMLWKMVGQTVLSAVFSEGATADRTVCPTKIHQLGGEPKKRKRPRAKEQEGVRP